MLNPLNSILDDHQFKACPDRSRRIRAGRRAGILSERLGFEREKIIMWSTAHALLSAWWGLEDATGWEYSMHCAKTFFEIK
jgi:streptomycin 6-kinase